MSIPNQPPQDPNPPSAPWPPAQTPGVWPPPPNAGPAQAPYGQQQYRLAPFQPFGKLETAVIVALVATTVCDVALYILPQSLVVATLAAFVVSTVVSLVTGVLFLVWTYRAYSNIPALGITPSRTSPGWAVGYFFIPILGLYRPYTTFAEIWGRSDPEPMIEDGSRAGSPVALWWIMYLAANIVPLIIVAFSGRQTSILANVIDAAITIMSAILAIRVVKQISERQQRRRQALEAAGMA